MGNGRGGDVIVFSGVAQIDSEAPRVDENPAWLKKYGHQIEQFGMTPASFAKRFSVPLRVRLTRLDGR